MAIASLTSTSSSGAFVPSVLTKDHEASPLPTPIDTAGDARMRGGRSPLPLTGDLTRVRRPRALIEGAPRRAWLTSARRGSRARSRG